MKNTKRRRPRRAARTSRQGAVEAKLLKICAGVGWICGWREERIEPAPTTRRSSRKRVMLGRVLAAEASVQERELFCPVGIAFVSGGRTAYVQSEPATETSGLADFAIELHDQFARLERMDISAGLVASALDDASVRSPGRTLWGQRRSML